MQNMQKVHKHGLTVAAALVALAIALASTGCATSRPYTKGEWRALGFAAGGQLADVGSTAYGLHKYPNIKEGNGVWGGPTYFQHYSCEGQDEYDAYYESFIIHIITPASS